MMFAYYGLAGVMYWGDASTHIIETAHLNGTRRTTVVKEDGFYYAFVLHGGNIYITDWIYPYDYLFLSSVYLAIMVKIHYTSFPVASP